MDDEAPSGRIQARMGNFLTAEGYQVRSSCLNAILTTFINRQGVQYQLPEKKDLWSEGAKERITYSGDDFVIQLLLNGGLSVRNLRTLFDGIGNVIMLNRKVHSKSHLHRDQTTEKRFITAGHNRIVSAQCKTMEIEIIKILSHLQELQNSSLYSL
jgi:flagellar biosynthesis component FlhA